MLQLAKDPEIGIAAGLEISYLDQTIQKLKESPAKLPNAMELALGIEWEVKNILKNSSSKIWQPLWTYLHATHKKPLSIKSEKRLIALSEQLATLFLDYGKYGGEAIAEWERSPNNHWQQELWNRLFVKGSAWSYLYRELNIPPSQAIPHLSVHLFSMSFLSKLHYNFFTELSNSATVCHYLLSPCQLFWSDLHSEKETARLMRYWKKQGASSSQADELECYMKDCNPLLANFGKLGRMMARQIEEKGAITKENYALPAVIVQNPTYQSLIDPAIKLDRSNEQLTLLQAIQADMVLLRNPRKGPKIPFEKFDKSIQIHASATRLREIQALYNTLLNMIAIHADSEDPIGPNDMIVMAPNIVEYEPFIKMVFAQPEGGLDAQILDLHLSSQSLLVQGFLHLLSLPFGRWDAVSLLQLFHYPAFQRKQRIKLEDLHLIEKWIKETGINWGHHSSHRNELLERSHCPEGMADPSPAGTWEFGMERLFAGLVFDPNSIGLSSAPYENIEFSQSELLGKILSLLRALHEELRPLGDNTLFKLSEWSNFLQTLFEKYFEASSEENKDLGDLLSQLEVFSHVSTALPEAAYSFLSIKKHLEAALSRQSAAYQESHLSAVRFCSILPMRTIPAKVVVWIGMHEGAFPRQDRKLSLNMLSGNSKADFIPSQTDFDRYLFLEGLLSARKYFVMSYLNYSPKDLKEQAPSLLVAELMNYIDSAYVIQESPPSIHCHFKHPYNAFDASYFAADSLYPNYSQEDYRQAKAFYHIQKKPSHHFIPQFIPAETEALNEDLKIDLKDLNAFARNPIKTYFNHALGIYLDSPDEHDLRVDEKFQLSPLDKHDLKQKALRNPTEFVLHEYDKKGQMPFGLLKDLALEDVIEDINEMKGHIRDPEGLFEIEFSDFNKSPRQLENGAWQLPPLRIKYRQHQLVITGKFRDVTKEGLVIHYRADKEDLVKALPQILVFHSLLKQYPLPVGTNYIFSKDGKVCPPFMEDPLHLLEKFLDYYFFGINNASPLIPEWVPLLLSSNKENIREKLAGFMNNPHKKVYNDYAQWMVREGNFPHIENNLDEWKIMAESLYGDFYNHWIKS
jgi:exodeoxyribonuclease V gamma subunit